MDKKVLKFYEAPATEVVEFDVEAQLLAGSPTGGGSEDIPEENLEPGFGK